MGTIISLYAGLRASEVLNLKWGDIDFQQKTLTVTKSKTKAGLRIVPLLEEIREALEIRKAYLEDEIANYNAKQTDEKLQLVLDNDCYVCSGIIGKIKSNPDLLSKWWQRNREQLGFPKITFHELRHTFATFLAKADVHPSVMQKLLGHSTAKTSLEIYTHVHQEDLDTAMSKVQSIIK